MDFKSQNFKDDLDRIFAKHMTSKHKETVISSVTGKVVFEGTVHNFETSMNPDYQPEWDTFEDSDIFGKSRDCSESFYDADGWDNRSVLSISHFNAVAAISKDLAKTKRYKQSRQTMMLSRQQSFVKDCLLDPLFGEYSSDNDSFVEEVNPITTLRAPLDPLFYEYSEKNFESETISKFEHEDILTYSPQKHKSPKNVENCNSKTSCLTKKVYKKRSKINKDKSPKRQSLRISLKTNSAEKLKRQQFSQVEPEIKLQQLNISGEKLNSIETPLRRSNRKTHHRVLQK